MTGLDDVGLRPRVDRVHVGLWDSGANSIEVARCPVAWLVWGYQRAGPAAVCLAASLTPRGVGWGLGKDWVPNLGLLPLGWWPGWPQEGSLHWGAGRDTGSQSRSASTLSHVGPGMFAVLGQPHWADTKEASAACVT